MINTDRYRTRGPVCGMAVGGGMKVKVYCVVAAEVASQATVKFSLPLLDRHLGI